MNKSKTLDERIMEGDLLAMIPAIVVAVFILIALVLTSQVIPLVMVFTTWGVRMVYLLAVKADKRNAAFLGIMVLAESIAMLVAIVSLIWYLIESLTDAV